MSNIKVFVGVVKEKMTTDARRKEEDEDEKKEGKRKSERKKIDGLQANWRIPAW